MKITATDPDDYIRQVAEHHRAAITQIREGIRENLPDGFEEQMNYGMIGYVVPHSIYPAGYHVKPELPLPFINLAAQKSNLALYHMGIYADPELLSWWEEEYKARVKTKLDMGKSCVRFKKVEHIPYDLIAELCQRVTPQQWISKYEAQIKR